MLEVKTIVGVGEALFDIFPDESRLGGAPLNVAVHAHQLGNRGVVISRVGQDRLGDQVLAELRQREMPTDHMQSDPDLPTGTVIVDVDAAGEPRYEIVEGVAWDNLQWDFDLEDIGRACHAICFGSLAQRNSQARNTIYRFLDVARQAIRLFDVNLRGDVERRALERSFELSNAAKLNTEELRQVATVFHVRGDNDAQARGLLTRFGLRWIAVTRGPQGTVVYTANERHEAEPVAAEPGGDAVGAGDATAAALLHGAVRRWEWPRTLELANALGAHVASSQGACPPVHDRIRKMAGIEESTGG
jgi:fructokinase